MRGPFGNRVILILEKREAHAVCFNGPFKDVLTGLARWPGNEKVRRPIIVADHTHLTLRIHFKTILHVFPGDQSGLTDRVLSFCFLNCDRSGPRQAAGKRMDSAARGFVLFALLFSTFGCWTCVAEETVSVPSLSAHELGYSIRHWTVEEGLPDTRITALAQTPDGYLWCGTYNGLARFDGVQFHQFRPEKIPELKSFEVAQMLCDSHGRLWLRGRFGKLVSYEQGAFREWNTAKVFGLARCGWMSKASDGAIWFAALRQSRYARFQNGQVTRVNIPGTSLCQDDSFCIETNGMLWGRTPKDGSIVRITSAGFIPYPCSSPNGGPETVGRYFVFRDGTQALTSINGLYVLRNSEWRLRYRFAFSVHPGMALDGVEDQDGNIWVGTLGAGLIFLKPGRQAGRLPLPGEGNVPSITAMVEDTDGDLWIGSKDGLYRLSKNAFRSWTVADGMTGPDLFSIQQDAAQRLWFVSLGGVSWRGTNDSAFTTLSWLEDPRLGPLRTRRLPGALVRVRLSAALTRHDSVWVGRRDGGVGELSTNGSKFSGFVGSGVLAMLESDSSGLWIGTQTGLYRQVGEEFRVELPLTEAASKRILALAEDGRERVYAAVEGVGLVRWDRGAWSRLTQPSDWGSDGISGMFIDKQGTVWLATRFAGLARWKDHRWTHYAGAEPNPWHLHGVTMDDDGDLWITSTHGVIFLTRRSFDDYAAGRATDVGYVRLGKSDGLASASCAGSEQGICKSADGRIWVATDRGASEIDPVTWNRRSQHRPPRSVHITGVLIDDAPAPVAFSGGVTVPPGSHRVEIHYAAADLSSLGAVRFKYRLEGYEESWVKAGARRFVAYQNLPPGRFRFRVSAANRYGIWNKVGASLSIMVRAAWWQTVWFRILMGVLLVGALWLTRMLKLRQLHHEHSRREEFARQLIQSQELERKRIAGDLHDSMGQDLILIKNTANLTLRKYAPAEPVQQSLNEMVELASHALTNARAITSNLRPSELDRLGLTAALEAMADKHAEHSGIHFVATIENVDGIWPPEQEINVYRVIQESLNNALKHAMPRHIEVAVRRQASEVTLLIKDDGCGFDPAAPPAGGRQPGMGLTGLQERIRILGGTMELNSQRGTGTSLRCRIPVPNDGKN